MKSNRMYGELAHLWPLISDPKEYEEEACYWRAALREYLGPGRHHLLELGVGGGHNLSHLTSEFDATAVDLSERMVAHSIKLNPTVEHCLGDMRTIRLGRKFDAVLVHDAIGYMALEEDLMAVFTTAKAHLRPGGVLITAADFYVETFDGPYLSHNTRKSNDIELTFIEYDHDPNPQDSKVETVFVYFITEQGNFNVEVDRHITGLFSIDTWERLLQNAGFITHKKPYPMTESPGSDFLWVGVLGDG